jgi:integrase
MSLGLARQKALETAAAAGRGEDPAEARARERGELTFGRLAERYMDAYAHARKRTSNQDERMLRDVLPRQGTDKEDLGPAPVPAGWRLRRLSDITRDTVAQLHARLGRERGTYQANRVLALIRAMFNLAHAWGLLDGENPARGVRMFKEEKRDRFLAPDELKRVLEQLEAEPDRRWRAYFKLALLLGPRKGELLSAKWEDFDLASRTWRLPQTKAGRPHLLPLPSAAVETLEQLPSQARDPKASPWLFPSPTAMSGHLEDPKKSWQRIRDRAGVKGVRVHDLRRTLGSWLAASGYGLPLIGRVLNHTQAQTTAVYARLDLEPVRAALEANARLMFGDGRRTLAGRRLG